MTLENEILMIAAESGWTDSTLLMLLVDFIERNGHGEPLLAELRAQAAEETEAWAFP